MPQVDDLAYPIGVASGQVYLAGDFRHVNGTQRYGLARVTASERIFRDGFDGAAP